MVISAHARIKQLLVESGWSTDVFSHTDTTILREVPYYFEETFSNSKLFVGSIWGNGSYEDRTQPLPASLSQNITDYSTLRRPCRWAGSFRTPSLDRLSPIGLVLARPTRSYPSQCAFKLSHSLICPATFANISQYRIMMNCVMWCDAMWCHVMWCDVDVDVMWCIH